MPPPRKPRYTMTLDIRETNSNRVLISYHAETTTWGYFQVPFGILAYSVRGLTAEQERALDARLRQALELP